MQYTKFKIELFYVVCECGEFFIDMAGTSRDWERITRPLTQQELEQIAEEILLEDTQLEDMPNFEEKSGDEEDHLSESEHDTSSEIDETDDEAAATTEIHQDFFVGKDKITNWSKHPPPTTKTRKHNIVTHLPGCVGESREVTDPMTAFCLFFDDGVVNMLVEYTNIFITLMVLPKFQNVSAAKITTVVEMRAFLGLLLMSGVLRASHLNFNDLFSPEDITGDFFHSVMSSQRFLFLLRCLRFDDVRSRKERQKTDKLAAVRNFFEIIVGKCQSLFRPSEYVTIDEQLVGFRGNCNFRQYIPSKPNKYGIKIFALVDARNFYNVKMEIYPGKQPVGPFEQSNTPEDVVLRLIEPIHGTGRNLTVDNWYTSVPLAHRLLEDHQITLVGTLRKNKREIPVEFLPARQRPIKSSLFGFTKTCTMVSYVPKKGKSVVLLSTLHNDAAIDVETREERKPEILTLYNLTKGGVDVNDKLCATYNVGRRTKRWPMVIFFHLVNVCAVNSLVITNSNLATPLKRSDFLKTLARALVRAYQINRYNDSHIPRAVRQYLGKYLKLEEPPAEAPAETTRRRCHLCPRKINRQIKQVCASCNRNVCNEHMKRQCLECFTNDR